MMLPRTDNRFFLRNTYFTLYKHLSCEKLLEQIRQEKASLEKSAQK